jgi:DNA gyrase/topoisomerase IV subunit A
VKTALREERMKLCEQAATEQDTERLMELIEKINRILDEKEKRLKLARHGVTDI